MKIKKLLTIALSTCMFLTSSISVFAAPKQMSDGTMFDAQFYAQTYPDVANALGTDEAVLYNHYVQFGKAEGRKPTADSAVTVVANTTTVVPSGGTVFTKSNMNRILTEDIFYGPLNACTDTEVAFKNRVEGGLFDETKYAAMYPDVAAKVGTSHNALWKHYKNTGLYEGRQAFTRANYGWPAIDNEQLGKAMILNAVATLVHPGMSEREICKVGHDWVCQSITPTGDMRVCGCSAIANGRGDCTGYSNSLMQFLRYAGINATLWGTDNHEWTDVTIDGIRYKIDASWDDTDGGISYQYFLIPY